MARPVKRIEFLGWTGFGFVLKKIQWETSEAMGLRVKSLTVVLENHSKQPYGNYDT